mmetsp:Transcript_4474/g.8589  ORF Transcript_4474/g.8589 Transcript_4474/m.8589 type:complete len:643 (-) Transcript_4474:1096-3024(-)|eukprot:CAMPEP_0176481278 /NCGR_PEP_ID=MMETSP0200_2-20121128/2732_1 /TAXON_ID=947934 /ORGANISM="Chaetoceros sp., Strain GSL56" /LENGTH=642 /DNA_ID=CAMNT_0017877467 /DNA_START=191 /DNA_END=2119 /DNA_ORIENTATION=-
MRHKKYQGKIPIPSFAVPSISHNDAEASIDHSDLSMSAMGDVVTDVSPQSITNGNHNGSYHHSCNGKYNHKGTRSDIYDDQKVGSDPKSGNENSFIRGWTDAKGITERNGQDVDIKPGIHDSSCTSSSHVSQCVNSMSHSSFERNSLVIMDLQTLLKIDVALALHVRQARKSLPFKSAASAVATASSPSDGVEYSQKLIALEKFLHIISKATMCSYTSVNVQHFATIYIYIASPELIAVQEILQRIHLVFQPMMHQEQNRLQALSQLYQRKWKGWQSHPDEFSNLWSTLFSSSGKKSNQEHSIHPAVKTTLVATTSSTVTSSAMSSSLSKKNYLKLAEQLHRCLFKRTRTPPTTPTMSRDKKSTKDGNASLVTLERKRHVPMSLRSIYQYMMKIKPPPISFHRGQKMTLKKFKNLVDELTKIVPEWIQIVNVSKDDGVPVDKSRKKRYRMVVIQDNVSYQSIREKLGAKSINTHPPSPMEVEPKSRKRVPPHEVNSHDGSIDRGSHHNGKKQDMNMNDSHTISSNDNNHFIKKQRTLREDNTIETKSKLSLLGKRRVHTPVSIPTQHSSSTDDSPMTMAQTMAITTTKNNHPIPEQNALRINHHQCMTEEDSNGGFVIIESDSSNHRALHRLFHKLNAGERI